MSNLFLSPLPLDQPLADDGATLFDASASWSGAQDDCPLYAMPPVPLEQGEAPEHDAFGALGAVPEPAAFVPALDQHHAHAQQHQQQQHHQHQHHHQEQQEQQEQEQQRQQQLQLQQQQQQMGMPLAPVHVPYESESSVESSDEAPVTRRRVVATKRGRPALSSSTVSSVAASSGSSASGSSDGSPNKSTDAIAAAAASVAAAQFEATKEAKKRGVTPALKRKALAQSGPQRTQLTKAEVELGATLDLSRDELLNMTSDALEEYAKRLAAQRPLTSEEQKRFKRQRRLIKNRESAQLSRLRKKAYVDELERELAQVKEDRDANQRRALAAERNAMALQQEAEYLRSLIAQHPTLGALAADRSQFAPPPQQEHRQIASPPADEQPARRARRSAVLA